MNVQNRATIVAALLLAIAGLALPAAPAATRPAGGANDTSDVVSRYVSNRTRDTSDVVSRYVANVLRSRPAASAQQTTLASSDGFAWSAALIGAGGALAIVLLLSTTGIGVVRHRHRHPKSA